jgi:D-glycero-D-manno-heptose 1,7-bisphosphate phosphatase
VVWSYSAPIALLMTVGSSIALIALWVAMTPFEFNKIKMASLIITIIGAIILWYSIYIEKLCFKISKGKYIKYEEKLLKKWENAKRISRIKRYVFLDRDGVINYNREDHVKNLNEYAIKSIVKLAQNNIGVVVISNQPIIGEGKAKKKDVNNIHEHMKNAIEIAGGNIDAIYYCPDKEDDNRSKCRKPNIGMFEKAKNELGIDFSKSFLVGDQITDIQAGKTIGCFTILVRTGLGEMWIKRKKEWPVEPDRIVSGIAEATNLILDMLKNK